MEEWRGLAQAGGRVWEAGWQQQVWWGLWAGQPHTAGRARCLGAWGAMEGGTLFPLSWPLGDDSGAWGLPVGSH